MTIEQKQEIVKEFRLLIEDIVDSVSLIRDRTKEEKWKVQEKLIEAYNEFRNLILKENGNNGNI